MLWNRTITPPTVGFEAVVRSEAGLKACLEHIDRVGLVLITQVPATAAGTREVLERIGPLMPSIFGDFWEFTNDASHVDLAYSDQGIPPHTDGTYSTEPPRLELFHCLHFEGTGAQSALADGFAAATELRREDPAAFEVLTEVQVPAQYLDKEKDFHERAVHPVLTLRDGELRRICFNDGDRAPFELPRDRMTAFNEALRGFSRRVNAPAAQIRFVLEPTIALLFDNWRVLHARTAFTGKRRMCGAYLGHDIFESRLRELRTG